MSSLLDERVALDTNEFLFAIRRMPGREAAATLLYDHIAELHIYLPLQVYVELQKNLFSDERDEFRVLCGKALAIEHGTSRPSEIAVAQFEALGAKKGDAFIAAELAHAGIKKGDRGNPMPFLCVPALPRLLRSHGEV